MWWIGGTPMGTLCICKSEKSSSMLSLEFLVLEVNALISLPEICQPNLASIRYKRELIVDSNCSLMTTNLLVKLALTAPSIILAISKLSSRGTS
jgi:hypothetical protein